MAFTVEDGNGLVNANAYIDVAFADDYFTDRGIADWLRAVDTAKQVAIIKATDYIDTVWGPRFFGKPAFRTIPADPTTDQALEFPRDLRETFIGNLNYQDLNYVYATPAIVFGDLVKPVAIPIPLKKACAEYAYRALLSGKLLVDPTSDASGLQIAKQTTKVGPIEKAVEYYNLGGISVTKAYPAADLLLKPLMRTGGVAYR